MGKSFSIDTIHGTDLFCLKQRSWFDIFSRANLRDMSWQAAKSYILIIIILCHQHGYPRPFLATTPYRLSLQAGPQGYIPYPHRASVCRFKLVALLLLGHARGVHWRTSFMSSSLLLQQFLACLVHLTLIVFVMSGCWPYSCCCWWKKRFI